jgi:hypothetical protein
MRTIRFNAWIPSIGLMLKGVVVYGDGMIGINSETFEDQLKAKCGPRYEINDDGVYFKGNSDEDDIYDRQLTLLCGEDWYWIEQPDYIPLQFTEMEDGYMEDLYDGDIIEIDSGDESEIGEIVYDQTKGGFKFKSPDGELYTLTSKDLANLKLGNKYNNPELVTLKKRPDGWHIPTPKDAKDLKKFIENKKAFLDKILNKPHDE